VSVRLVQDRADHNHKRSRHALRAWLSITSATWLLIFDDADEVEILRQFIPKSRKGAIPIMSRKCLAQGFCPFDIKDAIMFLLSFVPLANDGADMSSLGDLRLIAETCRCLPLALR